MADQRDVGLTGDGLSDGVLSNGVLTPGDWFRCAGLVALASLLFLAVYGNREGAFVDQLAASLVAASAVALVVRIRRDRA